MEIPSELESIVKDIEAEGGKSYLVGGAVIDTIKGIPLKDWDIEVYKLSLQKLESILSKHGRPNLVGKCFGIIKLRQDDKEYDFSIPRKENLIGIGHKAFEVEFVPNITPEEAAYRRDLTINSMFFDISERKLVDPYGGLKDLEEGVLRHTSDKFTEDSLRVLRVMQLLPRKGKIVADETLKLCKEMVSGYPTLAKERVFEEWNKLLMRAEKPSMGLQFLVDCGWIKWYPALDNLRHTEQNPDWHPEGSAWNHTLMVVDYAAQLKDEIPGEWRRAYMFGCLIHDVGKAVTASSDLTAHGHDEAGVPIAESFMREITEDKKLIEQILNIVKYHMRPGELTKGNAKESAWKRLHNKIPLNVIAYVSKADSCGRLGRSLYDYHEPSEKALRLFEEYGKEPIPPTLMGRHLIEKGYEPGIIFGKILKEAYEIQIEEGITDKDALLKRVEYSMKAKVS